MNMILLDNKSAFPLCLLAALLALAGTAPSFAQSPDDPQQQQPDKSKPAPTPPPPPSGEGLKLGPYDAHSNIEIGYRWVSDTAGNSQMYRSMVNLGSGPKVLHSDISLRSNYGSGTLFDHLDFSMDNWGGDPYNSLRLSFGRSDLYEFRADYRNLNYYNYVPTFANPLYAQGYPYNQHSLDVTYRSTDIQFKLFPSRSVRPYFAYSRSSGFGPAFSTYSVTNNEFLLNSLWSYSADDYRGGVEVSLPRLSLTLEQGFRLLKNDSQATDQGGEPQGNHPGSFIGNNIFLSSLDRSYHDRTTLPVSKALVKFSPFDSLKFTGRYIYSMSDLQSSMAETDVGSFVSLENLISYRASSDAFNSRAKQPNHNASFLLEFSPFPEFSILNQFDDRSTHISGTSLLASVFFSAHTLAGPAGPTSDQTVSSLLATFLAYDQFRNETDLEGRLPWGLTARAGFRYSHAQTSLQNADDQTPNSASYVQRTGILGLDFSRGSWLHLSADYESNLTNHALMRTDLLDFDQFHFQAKSHLWNKFSIDASIALLLNPQNYIPVDYTSHNRNYAVALTYEPSDRFSLSLDYARTNILSDIAILLPQTLQLDRSIFDERGHSIGGSLSLGLYRGSKIDFGYRGLLNVGSFPLNYHQPFADVSIPLPNHMAIKTSWLYFGYNEKGSSAQDFRTHLVTFALAYMR